MELPGDVIASSAVTVRYARRHGDGETGVHDQGADAGGGADAVSAGGVLGVAG